MNPTPTDLIRLLARMASADEQETDAEDEDVIEAPSERATAALREARAALARPTRFNPGDTVRWKTLSGGGSLKNRRYPALSDTAIVIEHLAIPLLHPASESGSPYFQEPLDLVLGCLCDDREYAIFYFDSRRFEKSRTAVDRVLQGLTAGLLEKHAFAPGQLVTWKPGLSNRKLPKVGYPMVVQSVLETPVHDASHSAGSAYFREPLDLVGGFLDGAGEYVTYHYDSRRFMPYQAAEESSVLPSLPQTQRKGKRGKRDLVA